MYSITNAIRTFGQSVCAALAAATLLLGAPSPVHAQDQPAKEPSAFLKDIELFGYADFYYDYFSNQPSADAQIRVFDQRHNQFQVPMVMFGMAKVATADSRTGFRLDMGFGKGMRAFHAAEPGDVEVIENIQEGFISYLAPVGSGLTIDAGKFVTPFGAELTETNLNWNSSRAFLFFAGPYYHSGVRLGYVVSDKVNVGAMVVNGWNNVTENNRGKSVAGMVTFKPTTKLTVANNLIFGAEQPGNDADQRLFNDLIIAYTPNDKLALMVNYDAGKDPGIDAQWQGIALYVKARVAPKLYLAPRFEWFDDTDAYATGFSQKYKELTLTGSVDLSPSLTWKLEYRGDFSDQDFFAKDDGTFTDKQQSFGFGVTYYFSSKQ